MTFNGPPQPPQERQRPVVEKPEYWKERLPFKSPRAYYELEFTFATQMAERTGMSLVEAVDMYAPVVRNHIHTFDTEWEITGMAEGVTDENMLERAWEKSLEMHVIRNSTPTLYHPEGSRFGCHYYDYDEASQTISIHFFNAEFEEEFVDGKDVSKGPLSKEKAERRKHELTDMFRDIKARYPEAKRVKCQSSLNNIESYYRLFPKSYEESIGEIDYDPKLWSQGTTVWGQFLGGNEKVSGQYGFKQKLADEFLEKVRDVPVEKVADALPNPPRTGEAAIEDFYDLYGIT